KCLQHGRKKRRRSCCTNQTNFIIANPNNNLEEYKNNPQIRKKGTFTDEDEEELENLLKYKDNTICSTVTVGCIKDPCTLWTYDKILD
ncbi:hypothetical protein ACJX0J_010520, partial [Zea mays]